ncbi:hypothetical protein LTS18_010170 [Coniosporium uncinatum]|uniref:Uncharacterized protein n=1 Tax=Coniosporium uncinatum TaxID=93489 RepID=A0ACC3DX03_9PEZI|nr:hypothetical protein LTS18_010170 [Coniosporium uncinatum]
MPEIRNHIYALALSSHHSLPILSYHAQDVDPPNLSYCLQPALTRTSRLLRSEGLPWFYPRNTFLFVPRDGDFSLLVRWALAIGRANLHAVGGLEVRVTYSGLFNMPVSANYKSFAQPLTATLYPLVDLTYECYMTKTSDSATGAAVLAWLKTEPERTAGETRGGAEDMGCEGVRLVDVRGALLYDLRSVNLTNVRENL